MTKTKNYYTQNDSLNPEFFLAPKIIFKNQKLRSISDSAKVLYIILFSRLQLSKLNKWEDKDGRLFVYFTLEDVKRELGCCMETAIKCFSELDSKKGVGLIERKRSGFGKPSVIYFKKPDAFSEDNEKGNKNEITDSYADDITTEKYINEETDNIYTEIPTSETSEKQTSHMEDSITADIGKTEPNKNNINNNKFNNNDYELNQPQSSKEDGAKEWIKQKENFESIVKNNISYDELCTKIPLSRLDEFVSVITHVLCSKKSFIKISDEYIPLSTVKERFLNLEKEHIEYVYDSFCKVESPIRNIRPYLITMLYQSDETLSLWIDNKRNIIA